MPFKKPAVNNLQRETLRKISQSDKYTAKQRQLAALRIEYSRDSDLLTDHINRLVGVTRVYPKHLPTQASGRWSTIDPPVTNWPRACVNQSCPRDEHEWTDICWSVRDIFKADNDEVLITWDHDNIEGKIYDLVLNNQKSIQAHSEGYDLHTLTCCDIFSMEYPANRKNPHTSEEDSVWRSRYNWQGKDTRIRVLAKNFNHGSKYTESYKFVHRIQGIEKYGVSYQALEGLAKRYILSQGDAWQRKLEIMARIRKERIARSLYGFRRVFFDSSPETGREGFSHMISGTVSDYNNETLRLLDEWLGKDVRLLHNAHDGDKKGVSRSFWLSDPYANQDTITKTLKDIIERPIEYEGRSLIMTAGIKVYA